MMISPTKSLLQVLKYDNLLINQETGNSLNSHNADSLFQYDTLS